MGWEQEFFMNVLFLSKTKHSLGLAYILHESILTIVVSSIKFSNMNVVPLEKSTMERGLFEIAKPIFKMLQVS